MRPLIAALLLIAAPAFARDVVVHAGTLIDGVAAVPVHDVSILITDDRITAVRSGFVQPPGAEIIDWSRKTVLPGLIDCHVHLGFGIYPGDQVRSLTTHDDYDDTVAATRYARDTLLAGFTSVRDVAAWNTRIVVALKNAIASGTVPGPRLYVAGVALSPTGGPGDAAAGLRPGMDRLPGWRDGLVDGPDDARRKVRQLQRDGADLVKIMPSGGVASIGSDPKRQLMTDAEIAAAVETAHALGMKIAAHAHGKAAIDAAVRLGVDSIEHGTYADAESYRLMKAHGTFLVPTLLVAAKIAQRAREHPGDMLPSSAAKALAVAPLMQGNLHRAHAAGVRIAFGTDTFGYSAHGENAQEFALMVGAGLTPMEAIKAATVDAAALIGASAEIGSVAPGRFADLVAVDGDPLQDIRRLEKIAFVMKGGLVVSRPR